MHWVDIAILVIIALSILVSFLRGFTKEALSLAGWVIAFWVALTFGSKLQLLLEPYIDVPSMRLIVAFAILFLVTLLLAGLVNYLVLQLIKKTGLTGTDRAIGIVFGAVRGCLIVAVLVLLAGLTALPQDPWWQEPHLLPYFQDMAIWIRGFLPEEVAENIRFS